MSAKTPKALVPSTAGDQNNDPRVAEFLKMIESGMTYSQVIEAWYEQGRKDGARQVMEILESEWERRRRGRMLARGAKPIVKKRRG